MFLKDDGMTLKVKVSSAICLLLRLAVSLRLPIFFRGLAKGVGRRGFPDLF